MRLGPEAMNRLCHDVGGGVAEDEEGFGVAVGEDGDGVRADERGGKVDDFAVDFGGDGGLGEAAADGFGELLDGCAVGEFALGAVGKSDLSHRSLEWGSANKIARFGWNRAVSGHCGTTHLPPMIGRVGGSGFIDDANHGWGNIPLSAGRVKGIKWKRSRSAPREDAKGSKKSIDWGARAG